LDRKSLFYSPGRHDKHIGGLNTLLLIVNNTEAADFGSLNPRGYTEVALTGTVTFSESAAPVPEPSSLFLLGFAAPVVMTAWRRAKRHRNS